MILIVWSYAIFKVDRHRDRLQVVSQREKQVYIHTHIYESKNGTDEPIGKRNRDRCRDKHMDTRGKARWDELKIKTDIYMLLSV